LEIIGVDFSGAKPDNNTWVAQGYLDRQGLTLYRCAPASRAELVSQLLKLSNTAVVALDFPFSVPKAFARYWQPEAKSMVDLWTVTTSMDLRQFIARRDAFVCQHGEPRRLCDTYYPEAFPVLHKVNPNLLPMTFYGMRMLARLWEAGCVVPPLAPPDRGRTTLLEVMPGAALRALRLPFKGYKNGTRAMQLRQEVLEGLEHRSSVAIENLEEFCRQCMDSHDCLDAIVAAVTACLWARDPTVFRFPPVEGPEGLDPVVLLEGWIYVPVFI
jgi:predicted nuclease with RNAse H fold